MTSLTKTDDSALLRFVTDYMSSAGSLRSHELEARVRGGVSQAVFSGVLRRLQGSGKGMWAFTSVEESVDMAYPDRTRTTMMVQAPCAAGGGGAPPPPPLHVRKCRLADPHDFELLDAASGRSVPFRVSCAEEKQIPAPPPAAAPDTFRLKKRYSFNRKNEVQFDLTEVRTGGSMDAARRAAPMFEVELEWRGQENAAKGAYTRLGGAPRMAEAFMCKLRDLCGLVAGAERDEEERQSAVGGAGGGAGAGRARAPPAPFAPPPAAEPRPAKRARAEAGQEEGGGGDAAAAQGPRGGPS
jgi:hypothetical protein